MPFSISPFMRGFVRFLLSLAIVAGLVLAVWPIGQTLYGNWSQRRLAQQWQQNKTALKQATSKPQAKSLGAQKASKATGGQITASAGAESPALVSLKAPRKKRAPWPLTKLSIPDIGLETFVVQGLDSASLRRGPGHDPNSSPLGKGNCVVAGHRNVYGSYFYRLDELLPGSPIILENKDGQFTYTVNSVFTTPDTNLTVLQPPAPNVEPLLTLITCTLPHTNNRIILQASLSQQ